MIVPDVSINFGHLGVWDECLLLCILQHSNAGSGGTQNDNQMKCPMHNPQAGSIGQCVQRREEVDRVGAAGLEGLGGCQWISKVHGV